MNSKTRRLPSLFLAYLMFVCLGLMGFSGCSTLTALQGGAVPVSADSPEVTGAYLVDMVNRFQKTESYRGQVTDSVTVQSALEESGATKKFRNMDVTIFRIVEENGRHLKMVVNYNPKSKSVPPEQNYAILPGDRIVVRPANNSVLNKMLDSFGG